jgi:hypothetical protein
MRRTKTFSGQIGRVNQRGDNLESLPIGGRTLCQDNKRGQVDLPVPLFFVSRKTSIGDQQNPVGTFAQPTSVFELGWLFAKKKTGCEKRLSYQAA